MKTPPLDYHIVRLRNDLLYCVDDDTEKEIRQWIRSGMSDLLDIVTYDAGDVALMPGCVISIEHTTPEVRQFNREHDRLIKAERIDQGFLDD